MIWIFKRARQFFRALNAEISYEDEQYLMIHLNQTERELFSKMSLLDQFHSLQVAYTIERLVIQDKYGVDREFLIRCALLHDVGKIGVKISVWDKVFAVLIATFLPGLADKLELRGNRAIYIYRNHAKLGGQKLQKIGLFKEAKIVALHHSPPLKDDPLELKILRLADDEN